MITYNVDGVKMPKIKKRDTSAWIRKVSCLRPTGPTSASNWSLTTSTAKWTG